nr:MAG TPA: hypothetical protein [Caudoviricetes sp.]
MCISLASGNFYPSGLLIPVYQNGLFENRTVRTATDALGQRINLRARR